MEWGKGQWLLGGCYFKKGDKVVRRGFRDKNHNPELDLELELELDFKKVNASHMNTYENICFLIILKKLKETELN